MQQRFTKALDLDAMFSVPKFRRNPFNYHGGKFKLLPQILPLFPKNITTFVDLFGGGGEISFNVSADHIIYNEKNSQLVNIFKNFDDNFIADVEKIISDYGLSKTDKEGFLKLRDFYNTYLYKTENRDQAVVLYCLLAYSFNNQIAFNSNGEYNISPGTGRSYFSDNLKTKLGGYIERKSEINIDFINKDFVNFDILDTTNSQNTLVYADPPYLITYGAYERDYFCKWSEEYEQSLLSYLDELNDNGYKFALSNVIEHRSKTNKILKRWSEKYNIHHLTMNYINCNYHVKDSYADSSEVLITNY